MFGGGIDCVEDLGVVLSVCVFFFVENRRCIGRNNEIPVE